MTRPMMPINKDRLSHWLVLGLLCWTCYFILFGIPIFYILLGVSMLKIGSFMFLCCALQLAVTPWMFTARSTPEHPAGKIGQRAAAAAIWLISTALLLLCYLQYGKTIDTIHLRERIWIVGGIAAVFGMIALLAGIWAFRWLARSCDRSVGQEAKHTRSRL